MWTVDLRPTRGRRNRLALGTITRSGASPGKERYSTSQGLTEIGKHEEQRRRSLRVAADYVERAAGAESVDVEVRRQLVGEQGSPNEGNLNARAINVIPPTTTIALPLASRDSFGISGAD